MRIPIPQKTRSLRFQQKALLQKQSTLLDLANDTIMIRNLNDRIIYWNRGAERLYGWTKKEAIGQFVHSFLKTVFPAPLEEIFKEFLSKGYWNGLLVHTRRDGSEVTVHSRWTLDRDNRGDPSAYLELNNDVTEKLRAEEALRRAREELEIRVQQRTRELLKANQLLLEQISERKRIEDALRASESQLRALSSRLMSAQEEERKRISRELHDDLGQILTSMSLDLQRVLKTEDVKKKRVLVERVLLQNNESRERLRVLSSLLRPGVLDDVGLKEAIQTHVTEFSVRTGVLVDLKLSCDNRDIPDETATHLYRILQEALTNISRHANAKKARIRLTLRRKDILLVIQDNGVGIDPRAKMENAFGLLGMKERAELLGGSFVFLSSPNQGTCINLTFPRNKKADDH